MDWREGEYSLKAVVQYCPLVFHPAMRSEWKEIDAKDPVNRDIPLAKKSQ